MNDKTYIVSLAAVAIAFTGVFVFVVIPPLFIDLNIIDAVLAGFVNPYAAGYSTDVIMCWLVLCIWILFEAKEKSIKYGWVCLMLGLVPGVAVGFSVYLILRHQQTSSNAAEQA